ncbi:class I SAM-dependent methyltransferase [Prauserella endophytica]|uniref:Class I SAM-dependent methyltransferase n=1 Tax=Prauserella endophytica TaxID=1592324 RepID=A0ABY2S6R2_9PSEU|nr:class I SAM-dependent methyltransferase [Prauserella endophytica]TKG71388.1 class I SAM-dependent methyltransferase [Prauserella endophytica]
MKRFVRKVEVIPSPNIWYHADAYELENHAQDVDGEIWRALAEAVSWRGRSVLDIGCGDGFHLARFAETAASVVGVEPHPPLVRRAERRVAGCENVVVRKGTAQRMPLRDASVDVVHARTAYFFGPGCEPGLSEADRVLKPGGTLVIVDLDARHSPYGDWMREDLPHYDPDKVDEFFAAAGFSCRRVQTRWRFPDRAAMEAVLRIEFSPRVAERAVEETARRNPGLLGPLELPVGYRVLVRGKPTGLVHSSSAGASPRMP